MPIAAKEVRDGCTVASPRGKQDEKSTNSHRLFNKESYIYASHCYLWTVEQFQRVVVLYCILFSMTVDKAVTMIKRARLQYVYVAVRTGYNECPGRNLEAQTNQPRVVNQTNNSHTWW